MIIGDLVDTKEVADRTNMSKMHIGRLLKAAGLVGQPYKLFKQKLFFKKDEVEKALGITLFEKSVIGQNLDDEIDDILSK
jgi:hypothetical protein